MDENEFFRQATLRICGNLEIEEALKACLHFLQQVMPVDRMFLQQYDHGFAAMRTIATARFSESSKMDLLTPLSERARKSAEMKNLPARQDIVIFEDPDKYPISREMLRFHNVPCISLIVMSIRLKDQILGSLVLITERDEKFTDEHARRLTLLKESFAIAISNTLKHREILKLKDLLADDNRIVKASSRNCDSASID